MYSQKDSKKLKTILLVIDVILLLLVIEAAVACIFWAASSRSIPELNFEQTMEQLDDRETDIERQIDELRSQLDAGGTENDAACAAAKEELAVIQAEVDALIPERDEAQQMCDGIQDPEIMKEILEQLRTQYGQAVRQLEDMILAGESDYRICYLTFDDGPTYHTDDFLDKLQELDAYATFFTIGGGIVEEYNVHIRDNCLRREAREGHSIANHTFTHAYYGPLYQSVDTFMDAVRQQDELVYSITGLHTDIVRFPSGSHYSPDREETIQALLDEGYQWMDWIGNAFDAGGHGYSSTNIAGNVIWQVKQDKISVVLMHDWNVNTLGALDQIVNTLRKDNYLFLPLFKESSTNGNCTPKWG